MFPSIFFWGIFIFVILYVPYPETLIQADVFQISSFFIPLFLALISSFNIFLKNFFLSFSISLGLTVLFVLKALDILNIITGFLAISATGLLISYFRKTKRSNLTKLPKIPKLTQLRRGR